ncbi:uncharacterized protein CANTADRAFT_57095 [Suhomyces tanzawaensis NRRL Y-17324]|uniref:STAS domain-containing protein n=1 Tax=Suhomyces tanzawaensis NRRL Y-17324 TaxID=984487 RepID=A0A1E4SCE2_9ASCO|nr:uncharacterized protein CANTADRAFT_57095 [Suhomyces tanzawaensis NRRL Y-17324]ODV77169.1 hypothetical protein CANTADRAFT_57095 [Suhomyces tanzawaensis NRRL Y-17324]
MAAEGSRNTFEASLGPTSSNDDVHGTLTAHEYVPTAAHRWESLTWGEILPYYLPCLSWLPKYGPLYLLGDLIGGLTLVFFQLPLSLSYATTLAHVPVVSGLFSLGVSPLIYLIFGSVPQMVVGPEGPISLVVGQAIEPYLHHAKKKNLDPMEYVVAITFVSGASLLGFGLGRFGFLDNVLSASLLKGFISGVGIVMVINALVLALGLLALQKQISDDPSQMDIHSPFDKVVFLYYHVRESNPLTMKISFVGFFVIMAVRTYKKYAARRPGKWSQRAVYIPEILLVVGTSTWLCSKYRWDLAGIDIIGKVHNDGVFQLYNPFARKMWPLMKRFGTAGFLAAMLGFFESTTASKSLGSTYDLPISSNRELVALGFINICNSSFGALPAFGGYGRSKINAISAKTTVSGAIMGICTLFTLFNLLDYLYFVPECMLSVITAVIGILLIEEAPYELYFHWRSRGYNELITFGVTVTTTLFFSIEAGVAVGLIYSLIRVIRHSAASRIQILGRYPGSNKFLDADLPTSNSKVSAPNVGHPNLDFFTDENLTFLNTNALEEIEGCLIIKIPEPLTFTNSNDLRSRLLRMEMYGSSKAHPALKRSRDAKMTSYIIFDLDGMSELDSSAAMILSDLLQGYRKRDIPAFFVRVHNSDKLRKRLHDCGIVDFLMDSLETVQYFSVQRMLTQSLIGHEEITPFDMDESSHIYNLIESPQTPFFQHISDALKVIDFYEVRQLSQRSSEFLEVDQAERRSSLPGTVV